MKEALELAARLKDVSPETALLIGLVTAAVYLARWLKKNPVTSISVTLRNGFTVQVTNPQKANDTAKTTRGSGRIPAQDAPGIIEGVKSAPKQGRKNRNRKSTGERADH